MTGSQGTVNGEHRNISIGGAAVRIPHAVANLGEQIQIHLPLAGNIDNLLSAEIVWFDNEREQLLVGLRFQNVEGSIRDKLHKLIELFLDAEGSERRKYPRVAHRIPVKCGAPEELQAILENISLGGIALKTENAVKAGEDVEIEIPRPQSDEPLVLPGQIIYCNPIAKPSSAPFRVGIKFKALTPDQLQEVRTVLELMLQLPKRN